MGVEVNGFELGFLFKNNVKKNVAIMIKMNVAGKNIFTVNLAFGFRDKLLSVGKYSWVGTVGLSID